MRGGLGVGAGVGAGCTTAATCTSYIIIIEALIRPIGRVRRYTTDPVTRVTGDRLRIGISVRDIVRRRLDTVRRGHPPTAEATGHLRMAEGADLPAMGEPTGRLSMEEAAGHRAMQEGADRRAM